MVYFNIDQSSIGCIVWIDHFPKDFVQITLTFPRCCNAPATISEADALIPSISTTVGNPTNVSYHADLSVSSGKIVYFAVVTTSFFGKK